MLIFHKLSLVQPTAHRRSGCVSVEARCPSAGGFRVHPFQRIRYYGFLCNRYREQKLKRCRELLGMTRLSSSTDRQSDDYRDRYETVVGVSLKECPVCHRGCMVVIEVIPKPSIRRRRRLRRPYWDSS